MTAQILQLRDYQQRKDIEKLYAEWADEATNLALIPTSHDTVCELVELPPNDPYWGKHSHSYSFGVQIADTAPSEMNADS